MGLSGSGWIFWEVKKNELSGCAVRSSSPSLVLKTKATANNSSLRLAGKLPQGRIPPLTSALTCLSQRMRREIRTGLSRQDPAPIR